LGGEGDVDGGWCFRGGYQGWVWEMLEDVRRLVGGVLYDDEWNMMME
jgi:hypothetical protein